MSDLSMFVATPDLESYDHIVVFFSGGKDSLACMLHLLECGVPPERIHLHHHPVDGREDEGLMDWPVTEAYCEAVAKAFGTPISHSWKVGGFLREMLRDNAPTAAISIPTAAGQIVIGGDGPLGTRRMFPQVTASLSQRWCSSYTKADAGARWLNNDERFLHSRTLVITGERAQESPSRAAYVEFQAHSTDRRNSPKLGRHVDQWRAIHKWSEQQVWDIIKRWSVQCHPCYEIGWSRGSCRFCIFSGKNHWASLRVIAPQNFERIAIFEREFKVTIHRSKSVEQLADEGTPFQMNPFWVDVANAKTFDLPIIVQSWKLPPGAFGDSSCGPS